MLFGKERLEDVPEKASRHADGLPARRFMGE
jgi:hypothetical protein